MVEVKYMELTVMRRLVSWLSRPPYILFLLLLSPISGPSDKSMWSMCFLMVICKKQFICNNLLGSKTHLQWIMFVYFKDLSTISNRHLVHDFRDLPSFSHLLVLFIACVIHQFLFTNMKLILQTYCYMWIK